MFSRFIQLLCFDLIFPANGARYFLSLSLLLPFSLFISLEYKREDCILLDLERSSEFNRRSLYEEEEDETKSLCDLSPHFSQSTSIASAVVRRTVARGSGMELRLTHFREAVAASYNCDKLKTKSRLTGS